jgi:hypothetical protein
MFLTPAGILLEGVVKQINKKLKLLNCYGPYAERQSFWDNLKKDGILKESNLILGGDLNFTVSTREIWGINARSDPLAAYVNQLIQDEGLIDLEPVNLLPTWRNGRGTYDSVSKRLDRFLISDSLVDSRLCFISWVVNVKISDHMLVVFQMELLQKRQKYPFKFNPVWLNDPEFVTFVRSSWNKLEESRFSSLMENLVSKLISLKSLVIKWGKNKKLKSKEELVQIEAALDLLYSTKPKGFLRDVDREMVIEKKKRKVELLKQDEEIWRQKKQNYLVKL